MIGGIFFLFNVSEKTLNIYYVFRLVHGQLSLFFMKFYACLSSWDHIDSVGHRFIYLILKKKRSLIKMFLIRTLTTEENPFMNDYNEMILRL
jgi:hypothetical protein